MLLKRSSVITMYESLIEQEYTRILAYEMDEEGLKG